MKTAARKFRTASRRAARAQRRLYAAQKELSDAQNRWQLACLAVDRAREAFEKEEFAEN